MDDEDDRRRVLFTRSRDQGDILGHGPDPDLLYLYTKNQHDKDRLGYDYSQVQFEETQNKRQKDALIHFAPNQIIEVGSINFVSSDNPNDVKILGLDDNGVPLEDIVLNERSTLIPAGTFNGSEFDGQWYYNQSALGDGIWVRFRRPYQVNIFNSQVVGEGFGTNQSGVLGPGPVAHLINMLFSMVGANPTDTMSTFTAGGGATVVMHSVFDTDFDPATLTFMTAAQKIGNSFNPWQPLSTEPFLSQGCTGQAVTIPINNFQLDDPNTRDVWFSLQSALNSLIYFPPVTMNSFTTQVGSFTRDQAKALIGLQFTFFFPGLEAFGYGLTGLSGFTILGVSDPISGYDPANPQQVIHFSPSAPSVKTMLPTDPTVQFGGVLLNRYIYGFYLYLSTSVNSRGDAGNTNPPPPYYGIGQVKLASPAVDPSTGKSGSPILLFEN